jgi:hypothetical protein
MALLNLLVIEANKALHIGILRADDFLQYVSDVTPVIMIVGKQVLFLILAALIAVCKAADVGLCELWMDCPIVLVGVQPFLRGKVITILVTIAVIPLPPLSIAKHLIGFLQLVKVLCGLSITGVLVWMLD